MSMKRLKNGLLSSLKENEIITPESRVFENRRQGCWSCKHWSVEKGKELWNVRRQGELTKALEISLNAALGENDHRVVSARRAVDTFDNSVALKETGLCGGGGEDANGNKVEFVTSTYLCNQYSHHSGEKEAFTKADDLAVELLDKLGEGN